MQRRESPHHASGRHIRLLPTDRPAYTPAPIFAAAGRRALIVQRLIAWYVLVEKDRRDAQADRFDLVGHALGGWRRLPESRARDAGLLSRRSVTATTGTSAAFRSLSNGRRWWRHLGWASHRLQRSDPRAGTLAVDVAQVLHGASCASAGLGSGSTAADGGHAFQRSPRLPSDRYSSVGFFDRRVHSDGRRPGQVWADGERPVSDATARSGTGLLSGRLLSGPAALGRTRSSESTAGHWDRVCWRVRMSPVKRRGSQVGPFSFRAGIVAALLV